MIKCAAYRLDELFLRGVFEPASVQREYQWTTKECGQLLADLFEAFARAGFDPTPSPRAQAEEVPEEAGDEEKLESGTRPVAPLTSGSGKGAGVRAVTPPPKDYFLGPMVLLPAPKAANRYFIYDGLQRFTSLSILVSVLRDAFGGGDTAQWYELQQLLRTEDGAARLKAPTPGATLATITGSLGGSRPPWRSRQGLTQADINMRDAAKLFHERTRDWTDARRVAFVKFLREHAFFAVTAVDDRSLAYKIFVTANDRGLSLQVGDIIKGRLVELVADARGAAAGEEVAQKWSQLQRQVRPHFDEFLRAVDFMEFREFRPSDYGEALLERFECDDGAAQASAWVSQELATQADRFATLFKHERMDPIEGIHLSFRQLYFIDDDHWRSVAMALQWAYGADARVWAQAVKKLVNACYIIELLDWPAHKRAGNFARALVQIGNDQDPFQFRPSPGEFGALHFSPLMRERARSALLSPFTDEARRSAIVRWLETLYWSRSMPKGPTRNTSVEHVLPRASKGAWAKLFDESIRDTATNKLGNLCIMPKELNDDLGNSEYAAKRAVYLTLPAEFRSAHEVAANTEWTPEVLEARTAAIAQKAASALGIQARK